MSQLDAVERYATWRVKRGDDLARICAVVDECGADVSGCAATASGVSPKLGNRESRFGLHISAWWSKSILFGWKGYCCGEGDATSSGRCCGNWWHLR
jgi:hypothetical protein